MSAETRAIDLDRPRDVGQIIGGAFRLYRLRFWLFAAVALAVVVPVDLLIYGVAGEQLWSEGDFGATLPLGAALASMLAPWLVTTPLITAGHVTAVMDLAEGQPASVRRSLASAGARLVPVALAISLAGLARPSASSS